MAGSSPAMAPMTMAAASPPAQASRGMTVASWWARAYHVVAAAPMRTPAPPPDLLAAFQHRDDHDVGDADRADQQGDRAEAEEQGVQGALGVSLRGKHVRGLGDIDLAGVFRVGLGRE